MHGLLPPPLAGEGWGGGMLLGTSLRKGPPPDRLHYRFGGRPPPQAGEVKKEGRSRHERAGTSRARPAAVSAGRRAAARRDLPRGDRRIDRRRLQRGATRGLGLARRR